MWVAKKCTLIKSGKMVFVANRQTKLAKLPQSPYNKRKFIKKGNKMIELAMLPPIVQEYIKDTGAVELRMSNGQIIATPKKIERPFNFEIDELDKAINSGFVPVPKFDTVDELADWLGGAK